MCREYWKPVLGYEGLYEVSNYGRVKSLDMVIKSCYGSYRQHYGKMLKDCTNCRGYRIVTLCKNGKHNNCSVHRLVTQAFIPNPNNYPVVNHKDENKANNFVWVNDDGTIDLEKSNLEWCTTKYNINYGTSIERAKKKKGVKVNQYTLDGKYVNTFPSLQEAGKNYSNGEGNISNACIGKRKSAYGYVWRYAD